MHFLFHIKKNRTANINHEKLNNTNVCAYPADSFKNYESEKWELYVYSYNFEVEKSIDDSVEIIGNALTLKLGVFTSEKNNILDGEGGDYFGDYLLLSFDDHGNGEIIRPAMSFIQCFVYEDNDSIILSSEIGLIVSATNALCNISFEKKYDYKFIKESIYNEWGTRDYPNRTIFKSIRRVFPYQQLSFVNSKINIDYNSPVFPRNLYLEDKYRADKVQFYDLIFDSIVNFMVEVLKNKAEVKVNLGLTGGLDSRSTLAFLREVERRTSIKIKTSTSGPADHPDVVLAKKIANTLNLDHEHIEVSKNEEGKQISEVPRSIEDYQSCFLVSQGDWNSNNYRSTRKIDKRLYFTGQDNFKRITKSQVQGVNRWYARRMSHTQLIPILANDAVNICASIYHHLGSKESIYEFVYYALKKFEPDLLNVPFAGQSLPMHYVVPYMTVAESKRMPHQLDEAYYDESLILNNLSALFYKANFIQLFAYKVNRRLKMNFFHKSIKIPISTLNTEGKKRIAMDFACSSSLNEFKTNVP